MAIFKYDYAGNYIHIAGKTSSLLLVPGLKYIRGIKSPNHPSPQGCVTTPGNLFLQCIVRLLCVSLRFSSSN